MTEQPPKYPAETASDEYALALGYFVREWNWLQDKLLDLFSTLLEPVRFSVSAAIWYSIQSDRAQRGMLVAAAEQLFKPEPKSDPKDPRSKLAARYLSEIKWIVGQCNRLGSQRDDAAHTPVSMMLDDPPVAVSKHFYGHPRAQTLKGKKLKDEFALYRADARALKDYAHKVEEHFRFFIRGAPLDELPPLPDKPRLLASEKKKIIGSGQTRSSVPK